MKKKIWLWNHYATDMYINRGGRHYWFAKNLIKLSDLKYNSLIFYGVLDDKIIGMSIILFSNKQMHYHLSAAYREYLRFAPINLLLYEAAYWGYENGFESFHLGGGLGGKEDSLYEFKKSFNRNSNTNFYIGKKIFDIQKYNELLNIRMQETLFDKDTSYFPKYRG